MLEGLTPPSKELRCKVRTIAGELDEADSKIFMGAVNDLDTWHTHILVGELKKRGIQLSESVLRKHRRNECSCVWVTKQ